MCYTNRWKTQNTLNIIMASQVTDNQAHHRFEMEVEGHIVFCNCRLDGNEIFLTHVETPVPLRGKGAAGDLMKGIMELTKQENLKVVPICSYAVAWLKRNQPK